VNWSFGSPASWSRDSRTIAFAAFDSRSNDPGRSAVFTVAPTGADLRRIIWCGQWITSGRFSPDGHWIAFDRLPGHDLFLMHANGSGLTKIVSATSSGIGSCCAVWSPDSTHLLFQRGDAGTATLWTVKADGTELTQLTTLPGRYEAYSWGP
jgi:Tol biopolymer transport system component